MSTKSILVAITVVSACAIDPAVAGDPLSFQAAALSGQTAPGTAGRVFSFFYPPSIGNSGRVVFPGWLTGVTSNDEGLWSGLPGSLQLVAREGSAAPGTTGVFGQNSWTSPVCVNSSGVVAFSASLTGPGIVGTNNLGIWAGLQGAVSLVARSGNAAPGTSAGVVFAGALQNWLMLNDAGQLLFRGALSGSGVDASNDFGFWVGTPGALQLVAREGDAAPGTSGVFGPFNGPFVDPPVPVMNATGQVVFSANSTAGRGIWRWTAGTLELVALTGASAIGISNVVFEVLHEPWMNASGQVVFLASLAGENVDATNNRGIWAGVPGAVGLVVRKGSPAPGTSGQYLGMNADNVGLNSIDDGGFVTLGCSLFDSNWAVVPGGGGVWRYGIGGGGTAYTVHTDPAPGLSGINMGGSNSWGPHPTSSLPFQTYLTGTGVNGGNDDSLWLKDAGHSPLLIVRDGDSFDIGGGVMRTIGTIVTSPGTNRQSGYNANRQMVIGLGFVGGTSGIFTANIPVPAMPGDMNCDQAVNGQDIAAFALAVLDPATYAARFSGCPILNGDSNQDNITNAGDSESFVACVLAGGCP